MQDPNANLKSKVDSFSKFILDPINCRILFLDSYVDPFMRIQIGFSDFEIH
jgi:hypothetical protein